MAQTKAVGAQWNAVERVEVNGLEVEEHGIGIGKENRVPNAPPSGHTYKARRAMISPIYGSRIRNFGSQASNLRSRISDLGSWISDLNLESRLSKLESGRCQVRSAEFTFLT